MKKETSSPQSETVDNGSSYLSPENQQQMLQLSLLNEIGQKIAALKPLDQVLERAAQLLHDSFNFHHVALFLLEDDQAKLKAISGSYLDYFPVNHRQSLSQGIIGWVATHGRLLVANEVEKEALYISLIPDQTETQSEICVPIQIADEIVGVLDVQSPEVNAFNEQSIITLLTVADQLAVAVQNAKLYDSVRQELEERKLAQIALRKSEARFRGLMEQSPDLILIVDTVEEKVIYVNNPDFLGDNREALNGEKALLDSLIPNSSDSVFPEWQTLIKGESEYPVEYQLKTHNGERLWVHCRNAVLARDSKGRPEQVMLIITDITHHRNIEQAMQEAQKLESLGVMASGIAHDFNNLLTAMMAENTLALLKLRPDDVVRLHIEKNQKVIERATQLTYQLLDYAGKKDIELEVLDVNTLIEQNTQMFQVSALKNISLHKSLDVNLPLIMANEGQLQQIIMNLIINAADAYDGRAGNIEILTDVVDVDSSTGQRRGGGLPVGQGKYVRIVIRDQGKGMDEDTMKQIFDPFFTTKESGQGLGLATVYGIVRSYQGSIRVSSELDVGTEFEVLLPVRELSDESEILSKSSFEPSKKSDAQTILVVEDEMVIRTALSEYLRLKGYIVLEAQDGHEALFTLSQHEDEIGVVILDMTMPVLSGEETLQQMHEKGFDIPIIASSGFNEAELPDVLRKSIVVYLKKPFKVDALLAIIQSVLGENES